MESSKSLIIYNGVNYCYPSQGAAPSVDSFALAYFSSKTAKGKCVDLCSGAGLLSLLMIKKYAILHSTCIDIDRDSCDFCLQNFRENSVLKESSVLNFDVKEIKSTGLSESFDFCITNPPYHTEFKKASSARSEIFCSLKDVISAGFYLLKNRGRFFLSMKTERLSEVMILLNQYHLVPKRIQFISNSPTEKPFSFFCEAIKNSSPGLTVERSLFLFDDNGNPTSDSNLIFY